jgi:hypothetical protein
MQQMEPHRRAKLDRHLAPRSLLHAKLNATWCRMRRQLINSKHRERPDDMRFRAREVRTEAQALVALAMREYVKRRGIMVVVTAFFECGMRSLGNLAFQTMARPMAAPARNGLRQHQAHHQFGNACLHNDPTILPNHYGHRHVGQRSLRKTRESIKCGRPAAAGRFRLSSSFGSAF